MHTKDGCDEKRQWMLSSAVRLKDKDKVVACSGKDSVIEDT